MKKGKQYINITKNLNDQEVFTISGIEVDKENHYAKFDDLLI